MKVVWSGRRVGSLLLGLLLLGGSAGWLSLHDGTTPDAADAQAVFLAHAASLAVQDASTSIELLRAVGSLLALRDPAATFEATDARASANLHVAEQIVAALQEGGHGGAEEAERVARVALLAQADRVAALHGEPTTPVTRSADDTLLGDPSPSALVAALAARHDVTLSPHDLLAAKRLDALPPDVQDALASLMRAFLHYQDADDAVAAPGDLANVLRAQVDLLDASIALGAVLDAERDGAAAAGAPFQVPPLLSIDLGPGQNVYKEDFMLLIDAGGNDIYYNNAGGNGIPSDSCRLVTGRLATALISYGGNDRFLSGRDCGANGGGYWGSGFLYNRQGKNEYIAGDKGTNGGAYGLGTGFLLDAEAAATRYAAGSGGTNGGGAEWGHGMLIDGGGGDRFLAGGSGTNGGGELDGAGTLVSLSGYDGYTATDRGTNGGAHQSGSGLLIDHRGNDVYTATDRGTNGGAAQLGTGLLLDAEGRDTHRARDLGANGGGATGGIGILLTGLDDTQYIARDRGTNGGAYVGGTGVLIDLAGNDEYEAGKNGVNGGAYAHPEAPDRICSRWIEGCHNVPYAWGSLVDRNGDDVYLESNAHASGFDVTIVPKGVLGIQLDL